MDSNRSILLSAYALAASRRMACAEDLELIESLLNAIGKTEPFVVQLGAGSGTMSLAVVGAKPRARLYSIDKDIRSLEWEHKALENAGYPHLSQTYYFDQTFGQSSDKMIAGAFEVCRVDLLIVDADHSYESVLADLKAWSPVMREGGFIFCHDYDGTTAPEQYPGVKQACDEFFGQEPDYKFGWSAVWRCDGSKRPY